MTALLRVETLSKRFGGLQAVADVSLAVTSGEICSVIGPNGAGKTTLFNMISGVLRPSGGRILFDGTDLATISPSRFAALGIGRTFQNLALFKHGTVVENILTGRHTHLRSNVLDGTAQKLASNEDVQEFYLGVSNSGRKSLRDVKHYKRRKRWLS